MTNRTQALGRRLIGALRNEDVVLTTGTASKTLSFINAKTGKTFAVIILSDEGTPTLYTDGMDNVETLYLFGALVRAIKSAPNYPAAKDRQPRMQVKTHGAPKYVGISMGSFKPGNLSLDF